MLISSWVAVVKRFTPGELPVMYYICAGVDPNENKETGYYQSATKKYNASLIIWISTFILHIILWPKILAFQLKAEKRVRPIELGVFKRENQIRPHKYAPDIQNKGENKNQQPKPLRY